MKVSVLTCTRRRDDKFLITYRVPGALNGHAVSDWRVPEGRTVTVERGKVVA
jgi:hypothetical protein